MIEQGRVRPAHHARTARRCSASTASSCRWRYPPLTPTDTKQLCYSVLTDAQKKKFEEENELDFSFGIKGVSRFRGNLFMQKGARRRRVPRDPVQDRRRSRSSACRRSVAGADQAAARPRAGHRPDRHRQVDHARGDDRQDQPRAPRAHRHGRGSDRVPAPAQELPGEPARGRAPTRTSFAQALKHILRQDPDVVLIGEMRDLETIEAALVVAETGHLVFSTLHTNSRGADDQPHHRRLPAAPAGAGARAALVRARGRDLAAAASRARDGTGRVLARRGDDPERRDPEPDPRGQGPPDLLADADRPDEVRHADDEPVARRPGAAAT